MRWRLVAIKNVAFSVVDAQNRPLKGATITMVDRAITTDAQGHAVLQVIITMDSAHEESNEGHQGVCGAIAFEGEIPVAQHVVMASRVVTVECKVPAHAELAGLATQTLAPVELGSSVFVSEEDGYRFVR